MIRFLPLHAILYAFLGALSVVFIFGIAKNIYQEYMLQGQVRGMQLAIQQLEKNNQSISNLIQSFQQESTVELEGRKDLNLQKPGEQTVVVIPPKNYPVDALPASALQTSTARFPAPGEDLFSGQISRHAQLWWKFLFYR